MGKQVPKMSARVVNAIKNLREAHGSTSKEIMNYIMSQYSAPEATLQRQMQAALKRGLDYGILKKNNGHYFLNTEVDMAELVGTTGPVERGRRRRRRRGRRGRRGRRRSRGRRRRRGRRGRRRRRGARTRTANSRRIGCTRCKCTKRSRNLHVLKDDPLDQNGQVPQCNCENDATQNQSRQSKSRERSLTHSRSSANSDQDGVDDRQEIHDQD